MSKFVNFISQGGTNCTQPQALAAWSAWNITEVTPICPTTPTRCNNNGAAINGVQEYYAFRDYNICNSSCTFVLSWSDCCRNGAITSGASGSIFVNSTTLNTSLATCNSSPQFSTPPVPYVCAGQPFVFNQGAFDPDGDSLSYRFGPCKTSATGTVNYNAGYTSTQPLGGSWSVNLNPVTGDITLTPQPGNLVVGVMCVFVDEWRNGVKIGEIARDIQVTVINCGANSVPTLTGVSNVNGGSASGLTITACSGSTISFNINTNDADANQTETLTWSQNLAGATFIQCGGGQTNTIVGNNPCGTFTWTPPATGIYFVQFTVSDDACPIIGSSTQTVQINVGNMQLSVTDSIHGCSSPGVDYCVTPQNGSPPYTFAWSGAGNLTTNPNAGDSCITHSYPGPGIYPWSITVSDNFGCVITVDDTVDLLFAAPTITGPADICLNTPNATYTTPNAPGNTYSWYVSSNGTITSGQGSNSVNVTWGGTGGADTIRVTEIAGPGCDSTAELVVNLHPNPTPVISGPSPVCAFTGGHAYSVTAVPGNTYNWTIASGSGVITAGQGTNSITVKWYGIGPGLIEVTQTDGNSCIGTSALNVTVDPKPAPLISGPVTACAFTGGHVYSVTNTAGNSYTWTLNSGTGVISAGQGSNSITVKWYGSGPASLEVTETNAAGCDSTVNYNVTVNPKPAPVIAGPLSVCAYSATANYATANVPGNTYLWTLSGAGTITSGQNTNAITVQWNGAGPGTVSVLETNGQACDSSVTVPVVITPNPSPIISGPDSICQLTGGHLYSIANTPLSSFAWTIASGNGSITSGQGTNNISVTWTTPGLDTVFVTETLATGCDTTVAYPIVILPKPTPVIAGPAAVCEFTGGHVYTVTNAAGSSFNWSVNSGSGVISAGQGTNSVTIKWYGSGPGVVQLQETNAQGCDSTVTYAVTVNAKPAPVIAGPLTACEFDNSGTTYAVPGVAGNSYVWTVSGPASLVAGQNTNSITVNWGAAGSAQIQVQQSSAQGCDSTVSINVTVGAKPYPVITGPDTLCEYTSGHVYSTPNSPGNTYLWTVPATGTIVSGQGTNSIVVKWYGNGTRTVQLTETVGGATCDSTVNFTVVVEPKPYPIISGAGFPCEFSGGHSYSVPANAGDSYNWAITGGTGVITSGQGSASIDVKWYGNGPGVVSLTQTRPNGCDSTVAFNVTVNAKPYPVISGPATVCEFTDGHVYSVPPTAGSTYLWSLSGGTGSIVSGFGTNSITVKWFGNAAAVVQVTQILLSGCDSTVSFNTVIDPKPYPVISGPTNACEFTSGHTYSVPPVAGSTWNWSVTNGSGVIYNGQGSNSIDVKWYGNGPGTVQVSQTLANGCDSTVSFNTIVDPKPYPVISGPATVCEFTSGNTYSVPNQPGNSYSWSVTGGTILGTNSAPVVNVNWQGAGNGIVQLTQTNSQGCDSVMTFAVSINPQPIPAISGPLTICAFSNNIIYSTPNSPGNSYVWTMSPGSFVSSNTGSSVTLNWTYGTGMGNLSVTETNVFGCSATEAIQVVLEPSPTPEITGPLTPCQGTTQDYQVANVAGDVYTWSVTGGVIVGGAGTALVQVIWTNPGLQTLTLYQQNGSSGCDTTVTLQVEVYPEIIADMEPDTAQGCHPFTVEFDATQTNGLDFSKWEFGDGNQSIQSQVSYTYNLPGSYTTALIVENSYGCRDTVEGLVNVLQSPIADFDFLFPEFQDFLWMGEDTLGLNNLSQFGNQYLWDFGTGATDTSFSPVYMYQNVEGEFVVSLLVTAANGCTDLISKVLSVQAREAVYIPNAFSPNGDGLNDRFGLVAHNLIDFEIYVYDRWGKLIFMSSDVNFGWDGWYDGMRAPEGVYTYVVKGTHFSGKTFKQGGTVTLIR